MKDFMYDLACATLMAILIGAPVAFYFAFILQP
jgi:hypothetical protein